MEQTKQLNRFVDAQKIHYDIALCEIRQGRKVSHWMWFIFPQLKGLGKSASATYYGIDGFAEARAYYEDALLGARLIEICNALLAHTDKTAVQIFGSVDAKKLRSCMTLFHAVDPECEVFEQILKQFYCGKEDYRTLAMLKES